MAHSMKTYHIPDWSVKEPNTSLVDTALCGLNIKGEPEHWFAWGGHQVNCKDCLKKEEES
jgi:hypothetical protein